MLDKVLKSTDLSPKVREHFGFLPRAQANTFYASENDTAKIQKILKINDETRKYEIAVGLCAMSAWFNHHLRKEREVCGCRVVFFMQHRQCGQTRV